MKKTLLVGLAIGLVSLAASSVFAASTVKNIPAQGFSGQKNTGAAGIVGSSHDLSNVGNTTASQHAAQIASGTSGVVADKQSRICVYCHHPHNSLATGTVDAASGKTMSYSPLWNRSMSAKTFAAYNNGGFVGKNATDKDHALNADMATTGLAGVSLLCMSCHDGVVAMNAYSVNSGSTEGAGGNATAGAIASSAGFSGRGGAADMSNHHPMGFKYALVAGGPGGTGIDDEIAAPSVPMVPTNLTAAGGNFTAVTTGVTINDLLDASNGSGNMECVTCHDVHNTKNAPGAERFLWRSNNQSNFCLTCHLK